MHPKILETRVKNMFYFYLKFDYKKLIYAYEIQRLSKVESKF